MLALSSSRNERMPTGIMGLDEILGGGFPNGTLNCVLGDIGTGTSTFCVQVVWSRLLSGGLAAYLCFDEPPDRVIDHFRSFGYDIEHYLDENRFLLQDGHPLLNSLASTSQSQNGTLERRNLLRKFLEEFRGRTCAALKQNLGNKLPAVSVVDSFSSLAPYVDLKAAYVLVRMIADSARRHKNVLLVVAHTGAIEANILCACNATADGIFRLESRLTRGVLRRVMYIEKMSLVPIPERSLEYRITGEQGMQMLSQP